jgi:hypothetical protein
MRTNHNSSLLAQVAWLSKSQQTNQISVVSELPEEAPYDYDRFHNNTQRIQASDVWWERVIGKQDINSALWQLNIRPDPTYRLDIPSSTRQYDQTN